VAISHLNRKGRACAHTLHLALALPGPRGAGRPVAAVGRPTGTRGASTPPRTPPRSSAAPSVQSIRYSTLPVLFPACRYRCPSAASSSGNAVSTHTFSFPPAIQSKISVARPTSSARSVV